MKKDEIQTLIKESEEFINSIIEKKYIHKDENEKDWNDVTNRFKNVLVKFRDKFVRKDLPEYLSLKMKEKKLIPAGSVLYGFGYFDKNISLSNCYYEPITEDSIEGIYEFLKRQARTYSYRGGVGTKISILRPKETKVNNAAITSSGSVSFMPLISYSTNTIGQNGRRGACIIIEDVWHPDIEDFTICKTEPQKVFEYDYINKFLPNVHYANISVRLNYDFMKAVELDKDYHLEFPDIYANKEKYNKEWDGDLYKWKRNNGKTKIYKTVKARDILHKIATSAWKGAEPGVLYWDNVEQNTPLASISKYKPQGVNPCITGNTLIAVADGRNAVSIKQLVEENKEFLVYSGKFIQKHWKPEIKKAIAFKTGTKKIIKIVLSDGSYFECTPDHLLALADGNYIEAKDSKGKKLAKFYSYSNKKSNKSYRIINSKTNGYAKQYRILWEFLNGKYDTSKYEIDHKDGDSTNDLIENLQLLTKEEHLKKTKRYGKDNPIHKCDKEYLSLYNSFLNIKANAKKYNWNEEKLQEKLNEFLNSEKGKRYLELKEERKKEDYIMDYEITVVDVIDEGKNEDVYDLTVEDNHNFYIITKTDDEKYLNSSGVLIHNCGEQILSNGNSCNLHVIVLYKYVKNPYTKNAELDKKELMKDLLYLFEFGDFINEVNHHPLPEQNEIDKILRKVGIEFTGLADMLAMLNIKYGTDESIEFVENLFKEINKTLFLENINLAKHKGHAPVFDDNEDFQKFIYSDFVMKTLQEFDNAKEIMKDLQKYKLRCSAWSNAGPTGSVSIIADNCSSGIEPIFMLSYTRNSRLLGKETRLIHLPLMKWLAENKPEDLDLDLKELKEKYNYVEAHELYSMQRIRMQSVIQKWITDSISSTVNLPANATPEDIEKIYLEGWKAGLKGITVYRTGSLEGILNEDKDKEKEEDIKTPSVNKKYAIDSLVKKELLPEETAKRYVVRWKGIKVYIIVVYDEINGMPLEIFAQLPIEAGIGEDGIFHQELYMERLSYWHTISRLLSLAFRYDIPIDEIRKQLKKSSYAITYLSSILTRILNKFPLETPFDDSDVDDEDIEINDVKQEFRVCPICGEKQLIKENGCEKCLNCGYSKCE